MTRKTINKETLFEEAYFVLSEKWFWKEQLDEERAARFAARYEGIDYLFRTTDIIMDFYDYIKEKNKDLYKKEINELL